MGKRKRRLLLQQEGGGTLAGPPTLTSLNFTQGDPAGGGQPIVGTGTNLAGATAFTIGGVACAITATTPTTVTVTLPAHVAAAGLDAVVTTPSGVSPPLAGVFEYWSPIQGANVDFVGDASKGVTLVGGKVSVWINQKGGETIVTAQQTVAADRPVLSANEFGAGIDGFIFVPQNALQTYDGGAAPVRRTMAGGYSWFAVVKYTSVDVTSTQGGTINCPLSLYGDTSGWGSGGFSADKIALAQFVGGVDSTAAANQRGAGFNDGAPHLLGMTYSVGGVAKAYKGATQQGADNVTLGYDAGDQAYSVIGRSFAGSDGFDGKLGAFVVYRGVVAAGDRTKTNAWAAQRFGTT